MNKPLANMATALLATETGSGAETEAVRTILQELKIQGHITDTHVWYFEPACREHELVQMCHDLDEIWITIDPLDGGVIFS